jgi:hypothetical protein
MNTEINNSISQLKKIAHLQDPFSIRQQVALVEQISTFPAGLTELLELLISRRLKRKDTLGYIDGIIFKQAYNSQAVAIRRKIKQHFHDGIVVMESSNNINYRPLYESLISNNFQKANHLTQKYLHALAGLSPDKSRQWLYFTDVSGFPIQDLKTIDTLWTIYSKGQFGFSAQKQVWIYNNKNWERFWHKIGWKRNKKNIRYPHEFTWDTSAPTGHLPLFNQLRGVQVLAALFTHPALQDVKQ